jgi:hypothetical protein
MPEKREYRKTGTVLARQLAVGETMTISTLEGPSTVTGPDWVLTANTPQGEIYSNRDDVFTGPNGYDPTDEVVDGVRVYRKKPTANVLAYQLDNDDHEPIQMRGMDEPFKPPKGYWMVTPLAGGRERAVAPDVFERDFEPADA